ncbi:unnamed protein product, partial [marine sediment metagenome]
MGVRSQHLTKQFLVIAFKTAGYTHIEEREVPPNGKKWA